MSQEKLREALDWLYLSRPLVPDEWFYHQQDRGAWKDAVAKAKEALDATSGPTDMDKLVVWLEAKSGTPYNTALDQGWEMAFKVILRHIRTEFGEGDDATG